MKTLYLDGCSGLDVRLDGPALRVRRPGRADAHYPLPRVARVVAVGRVHWQAEALAACLSEHKPLAVLDNQGRFVRALFRAPGPQYGLARHLGELLGVPRFRMRYEQWLRAAEQAEMLATIRQLDIPRRDSQADNTWQIVCFEQRRRWRIRVGRCHRYLLGLAAAQIASAFLLIGLPRDPRNWDRQEYGLFSGMVRLERWRQALLLEQVLSRRAGQPERWELTAAFEGKSDERERRIAAWRQRALLEMMGVDHAEEESTGCGADRKQWPFEISAALAQRCQTAFNRASNRGRVAFGAPGSLRRSARILRAYLEYDRRIA